MMTQQLFHSANSASDAKWAAMLRLLRRVRQRLSGIGSHAPRGEAELHRLSALPSCCFARVADKRG